MSSRAKRALSAVKIIFYPLTFPDRISVSYISFQSSTLDSHAFQRKHYHSDIVTRFRNIRLHAGKLPKPPHVFEATAQAPQGQACPVGLAGSHNNTLDSSLFLPFQVRTPDDDDASKASKHLPGSVPDLAFKPRGSDHNQFIPYTALELKFPEVNRENVETSEMSSTSDKRNTNNPAIFKLKRNLLTAAREGDIRNAYRLYLDFTKLAKTDAEVADTLIRALCRGTLQAPPHYRILQALQVYNNLLEAERQSGDDEKGFFDSRSPPAISEQRYYTRIYNTLLRALSAPLPVKSSHATSGDIHEEYNKVSMEILAAMKAHGLLPDNRTVCSILLLHLRSAANHEEAFEFYRSLVTELEAAHARGSTVLDSDSSESQHPTFGTQPLLDQRGYKMVLNAFGKLSFPSAPIAPAPLWFAIVKDMRERGHAVTVQDYTIYLGSILAQTTSPFTLHRAAIGFASAQDEEARVETMMACVKHVHKQLALDVNIVPDATLMNTLVNAYQHLGAFDDAMRVFNIMWLSGRIDDVTPVIMFDTCGHARRPREATMIWCKLVERGWQFDKHTVDTWVECLCRVGNVEAACKFVCMYMGRNKAGYSSKGDTRPDVHTCLILLKLSWVMGQNLDVKEKIRTHLPYIWKNLTANYT